MNGMQKWFIATRPKTLAAGVIPVLLGVSIAYYDGYFNLFLAFITLICALLIQITTNFINEIYDFKKGADSKERLGPKRMVASAEISVKAMKSASIILMIITFFIGLILVINAGIIILAIGLFSLLFAYGYTGGPFPLAYKGLGDIFVLIFFGIIAVSGTYYIQTLHFSSTAVIAGFAPGFLSMNILGVNNYRDIETDKKVGKVTLSVRIGKKYAKMLYIVLTLLSFVTIFFLYLITCSLWMFLPLLSLPLAINLCRNILIKTGIELNSVLDRTGKLLLVFGLLSSLGFILSSFTRAL